MSGAASPIWSKSGAPTSIAIWRFSSFSPYVPATPQQTASFSIDAQPGHEVEQVERRLADAVALLLAGRVVGDGHRRAARKSVRSSPRSCRSRRNSQMSYMRSATEAQVGVVLEAEDLPRLALEHQRAARRGADDVDARRARRARACRASRAHVACARRRRGRWTAAAARSSPGPWARRPGSRCARAARRASAPASRLVVVRAAAVEVDDASARPAATCACAPSAGTCARRTSAARRRGGCRSIFSISDPQRPVAQRPVGERGDRRAEPAGQRRARRGAGRAA